jgi:hypothetical protein
MSSTSHIINQFAEGTQQATRAVSELLRVMNATVDHADFTAAAKNIQSQQELIQKAQQWQLVSQELFAALQQYGNVDSTVTKLAHDDNTVIDKVKQMIDPTPKSMPTLTIEDSWEYTAPVKFVFFGVEHAATNYRVLYTQILTLFAEKYQHEFVQKCRTIEPGRKRKFVSNVVTDFIVAIPVAGVYFEGNLSANAIRLNIRKICDLFGVDSAELLIYTRRSNDR